MDAEYRDEHLEKTKEWAKDEAKNIRKIFGRNKKRLAKFLYEDNRTGYGFQEAIKKDNYSLFPHEIKNKANCHDYAVMQYFLADALGLKPRLINFYDYNDHKNNVKFKPMKGDHSAIDVDVGEKSRLLIDTQHAMYGYVKYDKFNGAVSVRKNRTTKNIKKTFSRMEELNIERVVNRMVFYRSPRGTMKVLEGGQSIKRSKVANRGIELMSRYLPLENAIENHLRFDKVLLSNQVIIQKFLYDDLGEFTDYNMNLGTFTERDWITYKNHTQWASFNKAEFEPFIEAIENLWQVKDNNLSRFRHKLNSKIIEDFKNLGVTGFDMDTKNVLSDVPTRTLDDLLQFGEIVKEKFDMLRSLEDFEKYETQMLTKALYMKILSEAKADGKDYEGFLYDQSKRDEYLVEKIREVPKFFRDGEKKWLDSHLREIGQQTRGMSLLEYDFWVYRNHPDEHIELFIERKKDKASYDKNTDLFVFANEVGNMSANELESQLEGSGFDMFTSYSDYVFAASVLAVQSRKVLGHEPYMNRVAKNVKRYQYWKLLKDAVEKEIEFPADDKSKEEALNISNILYHPKSKEVLDEIIRDPELNKVFFEDLKEQEQRLKTYKAA
ncbi:hypothetical protein C0585_07160 [Candidatus Woesearchaeota archaeon]|nr:MAG: hypothetical protein C0585_07160 [Candidatus Woesearchaeota archaeon]